MLLLQEQTHKQTERGDEGRTTIKTSRETIVVGKGVDWNPQPEEVDVWWQTAYKLMFLVVLFVGAALSIPFGFFQPDDPADSYKIRLW